MQHAFDCNQRNPFIVSSSPLPLVCPRPPLSQPLSQISWALEALISFWRNFSYSVQNSFAYFTATNKRYSPIPADFQEISQCSFLCSKYAQYSIVQKIYAQYTANITQSGFTQKTGQYTSEVPFKYCLVIPLMLMYISISLKSCNISF